MRRAGQIASWQAALTPLLIALLLASGELLLLAAARGQLSIALAGSLPGMPSIPGVR